MPTIFPVSSCVGGTTTKSASNQSGSSQQHQQQHPGTAGSSNAQLGGKPRIDSPDNDSAFSDNASMLSSESSLSSNSGPRKHLFHQQQVSYTQNTKIICVYVPCAILRGMLSRHGEEKSTRRKKKEEEKGIISVCRPALSLLQPGMSHSNRLDGGLVRPGGNDLNQRCQQSLGEEIITAGNAIPAYWNLDKVQAEINTTIVLIRFLEFFVPFL